MRLTSTKHLDWLFTDYSICVVIMTRLMHKKNHAIKGKSISKNDRFLRETISHNNSFAVILFHVKKRMLNQYDIIVVGAGHAGCEAAYCSAKMGNKVLLLTMNMNTIAQMSCNPAMGGVAKGQIIREIDALGGGTGIISDKSAIQFRMLNRSMGPAMWSPRTQKRQTSLFK